MTVPADFTTLPLGAMEDQRLSALDLRCLALIGWYDRRSLSRGAGRGCYAGHSLMAARLGVDITSFSRTLSRLAKLGYIIRERQEEDRRRQTIRVVYQARDTCQRGQVSVAEVDSEILDRDANQSAKMLDGADKETGEILDGEFSKTRRNLPKTASQETLLKSRRDAVKQGRDSLERAQPLCAARRDDGLIEADCGNEGQAETDIAAKQIGPAQGLASQEGIWAHLPHNLNDLPEAARLSQIERAMNKVGYILSPQDAADISRALVQYIDAFPGDPMEHQATRILERMEAAWAA